MRRDPNSAEEIAIMVETKTSETSPRYDERPWGSFTVLDEAANFKVKRIEVLPGKRLGTSSDGPR